MGQFANGEAGLARSRVWRPAPALECGAMDHDDSDLPGLDWASCERVGEGLWRPESVLATASGSVFVSDHADGVRELHAPRRAIRGAPQGFLPNGFALLPGREFLVANLAGVGGVWHLDAQGQARPRWMEVDGERLSTCNFVGLDHAGRLWITMSTRQLPRERAFHRGVADGFIALADAAGVRIVADGLGFANECRVHPDGGSLWVNETYARRLSRYPLHGAGAVLRLGPRQTVREFSDGDFPDGLAFDAEGAAWVACIVSNRVLRITPQGRCQVMLDDADPAVCALAERLFKAGALDRPTVDLGGASRLRNVSSVAFGGPDLRTLYLGNLFGEQLCRLRAPVAGAAPAHWHF